MRTKREFLVKESKEIEVQKRPEKNNIQAILSHLEVADWQTWVLKINNEAIYLGDGSNWQ